MYYKDKEVYTSSRGGKDYDTPTTYIRKNTFLNQFFNNNPNVVLDGELYFMESLYLILVELLDYKIFVKNTKNFNIMFMI